jgi:hypothetical protein
MADTRHEPQLSPKPTDLDAGGLHFAASFRGESGATLRVRAQVSGVDTEIFRFDDFIDSPHYHAPGDGPSIAFDRATQGEPLDWCVAQLRDHLEELLATAGVADALPAVDPRAVTAQAGQIRRLMEDCVPEGYVRVPGVGLQRA